MLFASSETGRRMEVFDGSCSMIVKCNRSEDYWHRLLVGVEGEGHLYTLGQALAVKGEGKRATRQH